MGYTHYWDTPTEKINDIDTLIEVRGHLDQVLKKYSNIIQYEQVINQTPELYIDWDNGCVCIRFNGIDSDAHETFYFRSWKEEFNFCKTAHKPYDIVVCECLLILNFYFNINLRSDGFSNHQPSKKYKVGDVVRLADMDGSWGKAIKNVNKLIGTNYRAVVDDVYGPDGCYFSYKILE